MPVHYRAYCYLFKTIFIAHAWIYVHVTPAGFVTLKIDILLFCTCIYHIYGYFP